MAGASLLTLLDDIASILDDVATMTKVATQKTAGVLSDDLALNAEKVSGVRATKELPVVWAVAKGSFINKLILIPAALLISHFLPWLMVVLLMIGGAYLCFEGVEKLLHSYASKKKKAMSKESAESSVKEELATLSEAEMIATENKKIKGAIRTDFILSAEIIVIALSTVQHQPFATKALVLLAVGIFITVGVYGLVAAIVKLDDVGYWMVKRSSSPASLHYKVGMMLVNSAPYLMRFLSVVGTVAMFLVGGGIIAHNVAVLHHMEMDVASWIAQTPAVGSLLGAIAPSFMNIFIGLVVGSVVLAVVNGGAQLLGKNKAHAPKF